MVSLLRVTMTKILKSPALWISLIYIIFFMAFAPGAFSATFEGNPKLTPEQIAAKGNQIALLVASSILITGTLITVITSFGESFVKIKSSLIYKNIELSNKPRYQFYVATIAPVVIYTTLVFAIGLIVMVVFDAVGLLGTESNIIDWSIINYGLLILAVVTTISVGISLALLISSVSKTQNTYTALTWAYLFLIFFFGGSSVPIFLIRGNEALSVFTYLAFLVPNSWSNFLFVHSMVGGVSYENSEVFDYLDAILPVVFTIVFVTIKPVYRYTTIGYEYTKLKVKNIINK